MSLSKSISETLHLNAKEASFFRSEAVFLVSPEGELCLGIGPFQGSKTPGLESFYLPGFFNEKLMAHGPELFPSTIIKLSLSEMDLPQCESVDAPSWEAPKYEDFENQVLRVQAQFKTSELKKVLPVVRWKSAWRPTVEERENLLFRLLRFAKAQLGVSRGYTYGYWRGEEGFLGRTPELLFSVEKDSLTSMALAGTAWPGKGRELLNDSKERAEHDWVVKEILEKLRPLGAFKAGPLEVLSAGSVEHLYTPIKGELFQKVELNGLAAQLHPTPALGGYPQVLALPWLRSQPEAEWRGYFGGPLGIEKTVQGSRTIECVVLIRGLFWDAQTSFIPCGCGIVEASDPKREWVELSKKKESVLRMLGWLDEH